MLAKWVKKKTEAFKEGTKKFEEFWIGYNTYFRAKSNQSDKHIGLNVIDVTNFIYNSGLFYDFVYFSIIGKKYERKILLFEVLIIVLAIILDVIAYLYFKLGLLYWIITVLLVVVLFIIFKFLETGEGYHDYYNRTMKSFILNLYPGTKYESKGNIGIKNEEISSIITQSFDETSFKNNVSFGNTLFNGNILDMTLTDIREVRDKNGNTRKERTEIFDGFYLKININNNVNRLRGNTIKIKADESLFSSITEDTVKGIYESDKEFNFNSEEMNKSFDCKISGYNRFADVDEMMMEVHKLITPSFEQHLLFLRERYNSFNMNISDDGIVATFNMDRSIFQQLKHKELLDFKTTYREAYKQFKDLKPNIFGIEDFTYRTVFPYVERMYLVRYLSYLYLSYIDFENYYDLNNNSINDYENSIKNIYTMEYNEFKKIHLEKIKEINKTKV